MATINDVMINIASALRAQFGDGYLDRQVDGLVIAISMKPSELDRQRLEMENPLPGTEKTASLLYAGAIVGLAPRALAGLLVSANLHENFLHSVNQEVMLELLGKELGITASKELHRDQPSNTNDNGA